VKVTRPHFRIQFPESSRGHKHRAMDGRVFVSFPEIGEIELPQVLRVELGGGVSEGWEIELTFIASAEVEYVGELPKEAS
jgi:hypothetical protein